MPRRPLGLHLGHATADAGPEIDTIENTARAFPRRAHLSTRTRGRALKKCPVFLHFFNGQSAPRKRSPIPLAQHCAGAGVCGRHHGAILENPPRDNMFECSSREQESVVEFKQSNIGEIIESERLMVLSAPERLGHFYDNAMGTNYL